jgi:hypothetical protein
MAFPAIQTADTKNGVVTVNSTSWTLTYPTNLVAGDLILAFVATDGDNDTTPTWPAGWIATAQSGTAAVTALAAKKVSVGTETGTFTLTLPASEQGGWRIFRITGWQGTIGTTFSVNNDGTGGAVQGGTASSATANPDPPSYNPGLWDVEDTLWFAVCAVDTSRTISVYPLADNNTADVSGGAGGATLGVCSTNSAVASLDPGTFTVSSSDDWQCFTVAIRPVGSLIYNPAPLAHLRAR